MFFACSKLFRRDVGKKVRGDVLSYQRRDLALTKSRLQFSVIVVIRSKTFQFTGGPEGLLRMRPLLTGGFGGP